MMIRAAYACLELPQPTSLGKLAAWVDMVSRALGCACGLTSCSSSFFTITIQHKLDPNQRSASHQLQLGTLSALCVPVSL
jgi:hypothetical protein